MTKFRKLNRPTVHPQREAFVSSIFFIGNLLFGSFLVCTSHFVVMFTAADGSGRSRSYHAYISQSTRGLRSPLKDQIIEGGRSFPFLPQRMLWILEIVTRFVF
ncbi:hypothetical protein J1N35_034384 [Gossypium stocksii]|uniref:Uncharacterized protein n=1 Tax=Gossypium stocksii TaxID=47602 RepID=A0A9D3ZQ12_9ROSI|nr:hypothetical protein J1N35_034384 [Gossypium stocksii]